MHKRTKTWSGASDIPGRTPEPFQSHTSSLKNNAAGLSSDEHENPLNGTQPNPFVYRGAPAVPRAGNSLPSGALVNGPASHSTSEVHRGLNKGAVSCNNVLDAARRAHEDTSPEVLPPPPSELQSDAWSNTAGPVAKTPATRPGVNTPPSHPEENESKPARSAPSGADGAALTHISQPLAKQTTKTRAPRDVEWSESSADEYDDDSVIRWDSATAYGVRRLVQCGDTKCEKNASRSLLEKVNDGLNHTSRHFRACGDNGDENVDIAGRNDDSTRSDPSLVGRNMESKPAHLALKTRSQQDVEWSQSSTDEDGNVRRDLASVHSDMKHNPHATTASRSLLEKGNGLNHTSRHFHVRGGNGDENIDIAGRNDDSSRSDLSRNAALDHSTAGRNMESKPARSAIKTRPQVDVEWSENSTDDDDNVIRWDSASAHTNTKRNPHETTTSHSFLEKVTNGPNQTSSPYGNNVENVDIADQNDDSFRFDLSGNGASDHSALGHNMDSKPARSALKTRPQHFVEWSKNSTDDDDNVIRQDSPSAHTNTKHNPHATPASHSFLEKVTNGSNHTSCPYGINVENVDIADQNDDSPCTRSDVKYSAVPLKDLSGNGASDHSAAGGNEEDDPEDEEDNRGSKVEQLKTERDPLFFSCTICNVNFKERRRFHRHMMYHLDEHNQVKVPRRPFLCRECGRLFCDSNSLVRHIVIHQDRLEKLIKGLDNTQPENAASAAAPPTCPQCVAGCCNCPKISVQRAKTYDNLKHYYFCEECNYITLTQEALEAHLRIAHPDAQQLRRVDGVQFQRKMFFFANKTGCYNKESKPYGMAGKTDIFVPESDEKPGNRRVEKSPPPSLWRVDRHGKLLRQPVEELNVATALTCAEEDSENSDWKAFGSSTRTNGPTYADFLPAARRNLKLDQMFCQSSENLQRNSSTMGKMSTPLHEAFDETNGNASARICPRLQKRSAGRELENGSTDFSHGAGEAPKSENPYSQRRFTAAPKEPKVRKDDGDEDCSDIEQLVIKEEFIEATDESPELRGEVLPTPEVEHKPCPYCPAMFESGVGLSNHVRGHLHRVGVSYNARHMVSPEQVALRDHQPKVRRRIPCSMRRARKAVKPDSTQVHTCPLCWGWFDTKTGLSNHVRGHLKRIGQGLTTTTSSTSTKSPLGVLKELLQDQREHHNILNKGFPLQIQNQMRKPRFPLDGFVPKPEAENVKAQRDAKEPASTLVQLLKMKQEHVERTATDDHDTYATRKLCDWTREETPVTSAEPKWTHGDGDSSKIRIRCNGAFPKLPGHLRAFARRKRIGVLEEPRCDYKHKKPRPGLKEQSSPNMNAERYTLTCRFCDLVFQGPPSIQEDWIRHLQRHLLHTDVVQSGTRMVEVLGLHHKTQMSLSHKQPHLQ